MDDVKNLPCGRWGLLNGSWLKMLALLSMTCDHAAALWLCCLEGFTEPFFVLGNISVSWFSLMRSFGRLAFPLFAFLVVEGFLHTSDRRRYGSGLLLFGVLSTVPWSLARYDCLYSIASLNILFTLFLGFLALCAVRRWEEGRLTNLALAAVLITLLATARLIHTDYETEGVGFILMLYVLRHSPALQAALGIAILPVRWKAGLAFIPIALYNGRRGFIRGAAAKYLFYVYYPIHLLIIYLLRQYLLT